MVAAASTIRRHTYEDCVRHQLEEEVLKKIRPSPLERFAAHRITWYVVDTVEKLVERLGIDATVTVEGSFAKDTWLSGDVDLDVFILIEREMCLEVIESGITEELKKKLSKYFPVEDRHAQHPYIRVNVLGVWVEVVPGCRIKPGEKPLTAVDRTPLHREYVTSVLEPWQRDEVRLLKAFMKTVGVYGAEIAVQGFSGYLVELLIASYGCFRRVLAEATRWKPPVVVVPPGVEGVDRRELVKRFRDAVMVVPDPVDPDRNAAAAVSKRSLALFTLAAKWYLRSPSRLFFEKPEPPIHQLPGLLRDRGIVVVEFTPPEPVPPDNLWGMAGKAARNAAKFLDRLGFGVLDYSAYVDEESGKAYVAVEVAHTMLPELELHMGPPAWSGSHAEKFAMLHLGDPAGPWVGVDGKLRVLRTRRLRTPVEALSVRTAEWLPGSMRGFGLRVGWAKELLGELGVRVREWLYSFTVKAPHWLRPSLYQSA